MNLRDHSEKSIIILLDDVETKKQYINNYLKYFNTNGTKNLFHTEAQRHKEAPL